MNEVEFKFELTADQYDRIIARLGEDPIDEKIYWSIYYDTPNLDIHRSGCCLRVSVKEDECKRLYDPKITFKGQNEKNAEGLNIREEVEEILPEPGSKDDFLQSYALLFSEDQGGSPWRKAVPLTKGHSLVWAIGGIKVHRRKYLYNGFFIEVDKVYFNANTCDYELEVETNEPGQVYPQILTLLRSLYIEPIPSKQSKHERFLQHRNKYGREQIFS